MTKEEKKEYDKKYRESHKEERKEYLKKYHDAHKEEAKEYNKNYRESHKEELVEYCRLYRIINKEETKEYNKNYRESHKEVIEKLHKKQLIRYYSLKNEFHGLNIYRCINRYYLDRTDSGKMSRYFSSLENYVSFSLNPDTSLKQSLIMCMRSGKISERDALDAAGIQLTEEDKEYIREHEMKYRSRNY